MNTFFKVNLYSGKKLAAARKDGEDLNRQITEIKYLWFCSLWAFIRGDPRSLHGLPNAPRAATSRRIPTHVKQDGGQRNNILHILTRCAHADNELPIETIQLDSSSNTAPTSMLHHLYTTPLHFACEAIRHQPERPSRSFAYGTWG
jgi:hypothetical protein